MKRRVAMAVGRGAIAMGRAIARGLPEPVKKALDDRVFYAIHQLTRVTNDHYPGTGIATPPSGPKPED